ncbi:glycosyltransferase [Pseudomonas sp. Marseille-P9899]|uniref:glycosyltransferase n=1 Tax=Pseudomonas sp. Marseille-P9899 TaxID=2730401 RepID=UPI00158BE635|nr:glycosyltransferase [Pseudomonas sp. Marseille-P9899]
MLFLANVLELNGGTTFLLRVAREYASRGQRIGVLVMFDIFDEKLKAQLSECADLYRLGDYSSGAPAPLFGSQLATFMPLDFDPINELISRHGGHVHVMGVFGVLLLKRFVAAGVTLKSVSFGIYHQNEIMYRNVGAYFSKKAQALFAALPASSMVFFNELNKRSHAHFFDRDYSLSEILPIGVELPEWKGRSVGDADSLRIVSIGNLHPFKAYNAHIIRMLGRLRESRPGLIYEIYGSGTNELALKALAQEHGVEHCVEFKGVIGYSDIPKVLAGSFAFVGSGTSIIESSALGIPSIVGIESIPEPMTYGFLSDVEGYSYNEMGSGQALVSIEEKLLSLTDPDTWTAVANSCRVKAETFSIVHTVNGLERISAESSTLSDFRSCGYSNCLAFLSFLVWGVKEKTGFSSAFSMRREQGSVSDSSSAPARKA